ncbi:MAG: Cys-Gln thioester bond-forming surface protein [Phycisphaerales bacterium]|jgi:hypothetical protein
MKTRICTVSALVLLAGVAQADMINVQFTGTGAGSNVHINSPSFNGNVFAGQLKHTLSNGTGDAAAYNGNYLTYCTDLAQHVTSSTKTYDVVSITQLPDGSPMGAVKANAIRSLYSAANSAQSGVGTSNDLATAFQLAVWEIVTDFNPVASNAGLSITGGNFHATTTNGGSLSSGILNQLNTLFAAASAGAGGTDLVGIRSGQYQDQILPIAVPAPGAAALASLGLLCMTGRRRAR